MKDPVHRIAARIEEVVVDLHARKDLVDPRFLKKYKTNYLTDRTYTFHF